MGIIMHKNIAYGVGGISAIADASDVNLSSPADGQILEYDTSGNDPKWINASLGTAAKKNFTTSVTSGSGDLVTSGAVYTAIDNLPEPMVFKGTLGTGGTITDLPAAASSNEGFTYKVITSGTYASQEAKVGDVFVSNGSEWVLIPAGDTDSDTWRAVKVNGTDLLGSAISTGAVNFKSGTNVTVSGSGNDITISADQPTVNNGVLTIQKNGTQVTTFSANQSGNSTANIEVEEAVVESLTNTTPYLYRKSPAIGTRVMENALVGASIVKNQLLQNGDFADNTGWQTSNCTLSVSSNIAELTANGAYAQIYRSVSWNNGHRYLIVITAEGDNANSVLYVGGGSSTFSAVEKTVGNQYSTVGIIVTASKTGNYSLILANSNSASGSKFYLKNAMCFDLTQMFGSTIADAAYTKEQSTAGSGIAWLKSYGFFKEDYYAYNTGVIQSVEATKKVVVGKNQYDKANGVLSGYPTSGGAWYQATDSTKELSIVVKLREGLTYTAQRKSGAACIFRIQASNTETLTNGQTLQIIDNSGVNETTTKTFTVPVGYPYVVFYVRNTASASTLTVDDVKNAFQVEIGSTATSYEPYETHEITYPEVTLRGLFELVGDEIKANGDRLESDGSAQIIMTHHLFNGSEGFTYTKDYTTTAWFATTQITDGKSATQNVISDKFISVSDYGDYEGVRVLSNGSIAIGILKSKLSSVNTSGFATWLSNNNTDVQYEKATPTTESLAPYENPQPSFVGGTEEFITNTIVPVGHDSEYKKLPVMFDDDYIQTIQERAENAASKDMPWLQVIRSNAVVELKDFELEEGVIYGEELADGEFFKHRFILVELYTHEVGRYFRIFESLLISTSSLLEFEYGFEKPVKLNNVDAEFNISTDGNRIYYVAMAQGTSISNCYIRIRLVD